MNYVYLSNDERVYFNMLNHDIYPNYGCLKENIEGMIKVRRAIKYSSFVKFDQGLILPQEYDGNIISLLKNKQAGFQIITENPDTLERVVLLMTYNNITSFFRELDIKKTDNQRLSGRILNEYLFKGKCIGVSICYEQIR